jgi:hypothetical protein
MDKIEVTLPYMNAAIGLIPHCFVLLVELIFHPIKKSE